MENRFSFQQSNIYLDVNSVPFNQGAKRPVLNSNTTENRYSWMSTYFKRFNPRHFFQAGVGGDLFAKFNGNFGVNLLAGYEWKIRKNSLIQINSKIRWIGGKRMLIRTSVYNPSGGSEWLYDWDNAYTQRTTDYVRLDLNAAFKMNFKPLAVEWYLEMNNLTYHRNVLNQEVLVSPDGKRRTMTTYQMGMNFMGGVRVYF